MADQTEPTSDADRAGRRAAGLRALADRVASCRACPRLVAWREEVAASPRPAFAGERFWARGVPGFGDPAARLLVVGLAPAAHGANRTGRMFTGDRSGDFLVAALHRTGFASSPRSVAAGDGLELHDCYLTAAVRCAPPANRPDREEQARCAPFLADEIRLLDEVRVVLALGALAFDAALRVLGAPGGDRPRTARPRFAHGRTVELPPAGDGSPRSLLGSYHPSQRNVFTGLLDADMLDAVLLEARRRLEAAGAGRAGRPRR